jgi:hypothetical protein
MKPSAFSIAIAISILISCGQEGKFKSSNSGRKTGSEGPTPSDPGVNTAATPAEEKTKTKDGVPKYTTPFLTNPTDKPEAKVAITEEKIPAQTKMVGVFKFDLLKNNFDQHKDDVTTAITLPNDPEGEVIGGEFVSKFSLAHATTRDELRTLVSNNPAIVALSVDRKIDGILKSVSARADQRMISLDSATVAGINSIVGIVGESKPFPQLSTPLCAHFTISC